MESKSTENMVSDEVDPNAAPVKKERRREDRRDQLLDVATRLFSKYGLEGTTTKDIAKAAQVSPGLLYHYYASKEELLIDVVTRFHRNSGLEDIVEKNDHGPVREAFLQILTALRAFFAEHMDEIWLITRAAARFPSVAETLKHLRTTGCNVFVEFINHRAALGEINKLDEPERLAGVLYQILVSELLMGNAQDRSIEPVVDTLLYGLVPRQAE